MLTSGQGLALGTAQLGMPYGVANASGQPGEDAARAIVRAALDLGIRHFDTAQNYGRSEAVLGAALGSSPAGAEALVTSKLSPEVDPADPGAVVAALKASAGRLGLRLDALLLHDENALDRWDQGVERALRAALDSGLVEAVGVSVYAPERALQALSLPLLTRLQLPASVLDRRFERAGVFEAAARRGVRPVVRSIFLQGLLLLPQDRLPAHLAEARPLVARFQSIAAEHGLTWNAAALGFVREAWPEARLVFGAETLEQLLQNAGDNARPLAPAAFAALRQAFDTVPERIVNPSLWAKT